MHSDPHVKSAPATILIVDDRPTNRQFLTALLGYGGHRLLEASDGAEALGLVKAERPDLVISDILMPTMDGFEFAKSVRADPDIAATKIVFYTATYRATEAALLAKACGVSTVIAKPAEPQRVLDVVNEQLGIAAPTLVPRREGSPNRDGSPDRESLDVASIGAQLTDYVNDLRGVKAQLDGLVERGLDLEQERERLRGISTKFSQKVAELHLMSSQLYTLVELALDLAMEREPARMLQVFAGAARRLLGANTAVICVLRPTEDLVRYVACVGLDTEATLAMEGLQLGSGLLEQVLERRKVVRAHAANGAQALEGLPKGHPAAGSFVGVPVTSATGCYGVAFFTGKLGGTASFDEKDERMAQALGHVLATTYENFELYDMLQRRATDLNLEVTRREEAQKALGESERALHRAQVLAKLGHVITGADGAMESWSETLPQLVGIGLDPVPASAREWLSKVHAEDRTRLRDTMIRAASEGQRAEAEYRMQRGDGEWIHVRQFIEPLPGDGHADAKRWFSTLQDVTEQKHAQEQVRESEVRFRQIAENIQEVFFLIDAADTQMLYISPAYERVWGRSRTSLYENPRDWTDAVVPEDRERVLAILGEVRRTGEFDFEYRIARPDGKRRWIHARGFPIRDAGGKLHRVAGLAEDITERKRAERKIRRLNRVYAVLSGINTLIVRVHNREELFREACRIAVEQGGFRMAWIGSVDRAAGMVKPVASAGEVGDFLERAPLSINTDDPERQTMVDLAVLRKLPMVVNDLSKTPTRFMHEALTARGIGAVAVFPLVVGDEALGVLALYSAEAGAFDEDEMKLLRELAGDISFAKEQIRKSEKLDYLAYYDPLTALANRMLFLERLNQKIADAGGAERKLVVWIMDIERFKSVNDALGRQAGDELLQQIAARMVAIGKDHTRLARIGADQFAIVSDQVRNESEIARLTETRLQQVFELPFHIAAQELRVSAHCGIAVFPHDGADGDALLRSAETAVKRAKASGLRYLFFAPEMTARVADKLAMENKLRVAIERREFVLHYQPKVHLDSGEIVGVEALIRWQSPELGLVPPMKFIPLLEETGLILPVGAWALQRAAHDHRAWTEQGLKAPRVAVNVSAIQLRQHDFVASVEQAIMSGLAPTGIDLEITESLMMEDVQANIAKLKAVRALGVDIAIDDFGTGYSSLGSLSPLPVQYLKIDRSFIVGMQQDPNAMTLVSTMISLAHSLRLKVVAEGVETEEQANFLRLLRCDQMQGYVFSKPLPNDALVALLQKSSGARAVPAQLAATSP